MATPTFVARIKQGFESSAYKTPEFKKWATQAKRWVTAWCKENGAEMVDWHVGHFEVSAFLRRKDGEFVYINSGDVRWNHMNAMLVLGRRS